MLINIDFLSISGCQFVHPYWRPTMWGICIFYLCICIYVYFICLPTKKIDTPTKKKKIFLLS